MFTSNGGNAGRRSWIILISGLLDCSDFWSRLSTTALDWERRWEGELRSSELEILRSKSPYSLRNRLTECGLRNPEFRNDFESPKSELRSTDYSSEDRSVRSGIRIPNPLIFTTICPHVCTLSLKNCSFIARSLIKRLNWFLKQMKENIITFRMERIWSQRINLFVTIHIHIQ